MLWQNTNEGFFADPMYGGNRDFAGWKLIGLPRTTLQLRQRDRTIRQTLHALHGRADGPQRIHAATERLNHGNELDRSMSFWSALAGPHSILAQELTDAGSKVLAIERGKFRDTVPDFATTHIQDELQYAVRNGLFEEPARETLTFRNSLDQTALPMRHLGSFNPRPALAAPAIHWNGQNWRFLPTDFQTCAVTLKQRYGKNFIPDDMTIQDWGVTYDDLEPYYDKFEYLCGISGQAGNVQGKLQAGGNPFEGPRPASIHYRR